MPDGSNNNTTSLNMTGTGVIGTRRMNDMTAQSISREVSRHNYRVNTLSDARLETLRQIVYKMVSSWSREDKFAILTAYGDASIIKENAKESTLNAAVTEALIINLDPRDLNQLANDVTVKQNKLKSDIKKIESSRKVLGNRFGVKGFEDVAKTSQFAKNPKAIAKKIREYDKSFKVPLTIQSQFKKLKKEILDVLKKCFNKVQVLNIAYKMNIDTSSIDLDEVKESIANKVILYASLLTGKSKAQMYGGAFMDTEPYNDILQYTSFSYLTGKPGLSAGKWVTLKQNAVKAKMAMRAAKNQKKIGESQHGIKLGVIRNIVNLAQDAKYKREYELAGSPYRNTPIDELAEKAAKYGLNLSSVRYRKRENIEIDIYRAEAKDMQKVKKLYKRGARRGIGWLGYRDTEAMRITGRHGSKTNMLLEADQRTESWKFDEGTDTTSTGIPIIKMGKTDVTKVKKAIPVYIVGNTAAMSIEKLYSTLEKPEEKKKKAEGLSSYSAVLTDKNRMLKELSKKNSNASSKLLQGDSPLKLNQGKQYQFTKDDIARGEREGWLKGLREGQSEIENTLNSRLEKAQSRVDELKNTKALFEKAGVHDKKLNKELSESEKILADIQMRNSAANVIKQLGGEVPDGIITMKPKAIAKELRKAVKIYKKNLKKGKVKTDQVSIEATKLGINSIATADAMPVYAVNSVLSTNAFEQLQKTITAANVSTASTIGSKLGTLMTGLSTWVLGAPMGVGAMTSPTLIAMGVADKIQDLIAQGMDTAADVIGTMGGSARLATGGTVKSSQSMASAITGDAMGSNIFKGGAKPELVKSTGDLSVQPLNKAGTEDKQRVSRMNTSDRRNALATSIASHAVKFSYKLPEGVQEITNSGEAIKVFNVKPGITDIISAGGQETTVADLLANIYAQLSIISQNGTAGNQLLSTIAAKPTASVPSSGGGNPNPFAGGFPDSMSAILGGN